MERGNKWRDKVRKVKGVKERWRERDKGKDINIDKKLEKLKDRKKKLTDRARVTERECLRGKEKETDKNIKVERKRQTEKGIKEIKRERQ
jgi:hypothetical protein